MKDCVSLENCECIRISECSRSLLDGFYIDDEKDAKSLEYYLKFPDGAMLEELNHTARTYVIVDKTLNCIIGYFTLRAGQCNIKRGWLFRRKTFIIPGIELAMFAVNDRYRKLYAGPHFSFGEWIFYTYVSEKAIEASEIIGVKILYIFALPEKPKLISFYNKIGFVNPLYVSGKKKKVRTVIPTFDQGCIFMFQTIK